jgi:hypothetical protein
VKTLPEGWTSAAIAEGWLEPWPALKIHVESNPESRWRFRAALVDASDTEQEAPDLEWRFQVEGSEVVRSERPDFPPLESPGMEQAFKEGRRVTVGVYLNEGELASTTLTGPKPDLPSPGLEGPGPSGTPDAPGAAPHGPHW